MAVAVAIGASGICADTGVSNQWIKCVGSFFTGTGFCGVRSHDSSDSSCGSAPRREQGEM
eukprot:3100187-Pleurochrysis_carterae.AAC.1